MPILHDNRNMRPDLLNESTESVDDIFSAADANMAQQRQKMLTIRPSPFKNWRHRMKRFYVTTSIITLICLIAAGVWGLKVAHNTTVAEIETQILFEVKKTKAQLALKNEADYTAEDIFLLSVFDVLSEDDIRNIIRNATSPEEIFAFMTTANVDFKKYLTPEQTNQLEDAIVQYTLELEAKVNELESTHSEETVSEGDVLPSENIDSADDDAPETTENLS